MNFITIDADVFGFLIDGAELRLILRNFCPERPFPGRMKPSGPAFGRPDGKLRERRAGNQRKNVAEGALCF